MPEVIYQTHTTIPKFIGNMTTTFHDILVENLHPEPCYCCGRPMLRGKDSDGKERLLCIGNIRFIEACKYFDAEECKMDGNCLGQDMVKERGQPVGDESMIRVVEPIYHLLLGALKAWPEKKD